MRVVDGMTDKTYQWTSIEDQKPPLECVCFLSCGTSIKFGARIVIDAEDDPRPVFCGIFGAPRFYKDSCQWFAEFDIDNILHPTHWMPLPTPPAKTGE